LACAHVLEKDAAKFYSTTANTRSFGPSSNMSMVYTHEHLVFGYKNLALAQPEKEEEPVGTKCLECNQFYSGAPTFCTECGEAACAGCIVGTPPCALFASRSLPRGFPR
jgi:hypothetical protein